MKKVSDHLNIRTRFIFIVVISKFSLQNKEKVQCMCHCICEGYEQHSKVRQMVNFMHRSKGGGGLQNSNLFKLNYETTKHMPWTPLGKLNRWTPLPPSPMDKFSGSAHEPESFTLSRLYRINVSDCCTAEHDYTLACSFL